MTPPRRRQTTAAADLAGPVGTVEQPAGRWVQYLPIDEIEPALTNPKRHADQAILDSITLHGYADQILMDDRTGRVVAGHGRLDALRALEERGDWPPDGVTLDPDTGKWLIPVNRGWASRDDAHAKAYGIVANRLTELGGWDDRELLDELITLDDAGLLAAAAYDKAGLDELLAAVTTRDKRSARENRDPDVQPTVPAKPKTRPGDVWLLGPHRLACGDAGDPDVADAALDGNPIDLVFTSPPYNVGVGYDGHDDRTVPWPAYARFLHPILETTIDRMADGRALCWNTGTSPDTHHANQHVLIEQLGLTYLRTLVWQKVGVPVPLWHNTAANPRARKFTPNYTHELVAVYTRDHLADPKDPDPNDALAVVPARRPLDPAPLHELVAVFASAKKLKAGRAVHFDDILRNDVFQLAQSKATSDLPTDDTQPLTGAQSGLKTRGRKVHPAAFPVELPERFIAHLADLAATVYDPFAGSGSTLLACHYTGRLFAGTEISPAYCDVAAARWQRATDITPVLLRDGHHKTTDMTRLAATADDEADQ